MIRRTCQRTTMHSPHLQRPLRVLAPFFAGFLAAAALHAGIGCSGGPSAPDSGGSGNEAVERSLRESAQAVENAFLSGNADSVSTVMTETARAVYGAGVAAAPAEGLVEFGHALESRELTVYGDTYAEYAYSFNGVPYTFALALQMDGSWKLMRF